jgi:hypothetical protein
MIKRYFLVCFLSIWIAACNTPIKEERKPEASVFYEIFPVLIDTFHFDNRLIIYELNNDTLKLDSLARDTTSIIIAISDTLRLLKKEDYLSLKDHLRVSLKEVDSMIEDTLRILDIPRLQARDKRIKFKPLSSFPKGIEFWKTNYDFYLSAKFYFSNILFNKDKTSGLLQVGYLCGPYRCGEGFLVYLKKNKDGWVIEKVEDTWAM